MHIYTYLKYKTYLIENMKTVGIKIDRNSYNCELSPHSYAYRSISLIRNCKLNLKAIKIKANYSESRPDISAASTSALSIF